MKNRRSNGLVIGLILATLTLAPSAGRAAAGKKPTISATVGGKHVTWRGRLVSFTYGPSGLIVIGTKNRATKTIGFGCPILLEGETYPVTMTSCSGQYAQHAGKMYWFNVNTFQVTFASFDGTIVQGTFSGTLPGVAGATGPLAVEGSFRGPIRTK